MNKFFFVLALLAGISFIPAPASAQSDPCALAVNVNSQECIMHMREGRPPVAYDNALICTLIHVYGTRKVTFVVMNGAGEILNPENPQHTSYKSDGEYMCVGAHWWQKALETGGHVEFCIDFEPGYESRWVYRFFKIEERLSFVPTYGAYAPPGRFVAGLRVEEPRSGEVLKQWIPRVLENPRPTLL